MTTAHVTRVLYVDDNAMDRALVRNALTREEAGFELVEAATPEDFIAALEAGSWSLVLTDINILGFSGLDIVDLVRRQEPALPVIVVTGTGSEETAVEALHRGVDDYVIKTPSHILRLPQTIRAALERKRLRDEKEQATAEVLRLNNELEQRVLQRTAQLQEALEDLEAFSASVAHDLRAPLRAIDGYAALLLQDTGLLSESGRRALEHVREAAQRMAQLIEGLLRLARLSQRELSPAPVDLSDLAAQVVERLRAAEPDRLVEVHIQPGLVARGDAVLLGNVLENLLGNAWKFTRHTDRPRVEVGALPGGGGSPVYYVRDNGAGFEPAQAERLFVPFRRLHAEAEFPGLGIGLATVRRIIRRHGGRIWAEAAPGQGASFYFTLG